MSTPQRFVIVVLLASAAGCGSVEGRWKGKVDCGDGGSVDMRLKIVEKNDQRYTADGSVAGLSLQGRDASVEMEMDITQREPSGAQKLKVNADCVLFVDDVAPQQLDCSGLDQLGWDGADRIKATVENYMGTGYTCDIQLRR